MLTYPFPQVRTARSAADVPPELIATIEQAIDGLSGRRSGGEVHFLCPLHDDRAPSARWNPRKLCWFCDVCATGGGAYDLAKKLDIEIPRQERRADTGYKPMHRLITGKRGWN